MQNGKKNDHNKLHEMMHWIEENLIFFLLKLFWDFVWILFKKRRIKITIQIFY